MHGAVASKALGGALVRAVLDDWRAAPVDGRLRAALALLEKLTLAPAEVEPRDIAPLRASGATDEAIEDAIRICALFNLIDRVADALGFRVPGPETFSRGAALLLKHGYTN